MLVASAATGCSSQVSEPASNEPASRASTSQTVAVKQVNLANIKRIRALLPGDYEISELRGPISVAAEWGFGSGWTVEPVGCASIVDPAPDQANAQGFVASGAGGIIYIALAGLDPAQSGTDLADECRQWTMAFGHTTGTFERTDVPNLEAVQALDGRTVGVSGLARTSVESGTETHTHIVAAYAYVGNYVVEVSVITDPGSGRPGLSSDFATDLLDKAVQVLQQ